ncbi:MAG: protein kinase, partial [Polyangia bacterium]|nr:protein kinase [Polyangia bacterium]
NIIVLSRSRPSEVVKVLDFGIAKILEAGVSEESRITKSGAIFGTPYYLSPEQATGAELDSRADLYSLGVILYRLLTGHLPFESGSGLEILVRHVKEPPPSPRLHRPELPASLEEVILTSLQKDRERRFKTADAMRNALLAAAQDLPVAPSHHGAASAWSVPGDADPSDGKKTVAGFAAAPGVEPGPPPSPEKDPLVRAARLLLSPGEEGVPSKPIRESRPTVLGGPALGKDGLPAPEPARAQAAAGASGSPAAAKSGRAGTWRPTGESDLDTDDLPGASRIQSAPSAPAPIPKLILDQGSGRVLGGVQGAFSEPRSGPGSARVTTANADSDAPSYSAPASISRPQASRRLSEPASTDSSPSVVTGQHTAPSASIILALRKASRRGRSITFAAAALALVALGVGVFFALEDWRPRRSGAASQSAPAPSRDASTAMAPERAAPDGQVSEPALAVGVELLRVLDQGVVARLSCEQAIKAGDEPLLVLDLWLDGRGRPIPDAEATLELARSARRKVKVQSSSTGVVGRYQFKASFPWPGAWAGTLEVRLPGEKVIRTPARLSVEPRPGSDAHPGRRRPPPPRDGPEPMDGLPRPPPDEGMTEPDRLPPPPGDPPVPPPDPD